MKVSDDYILREIMGEYIIVPSGKAVENLNGLAATNETGASIFKFLKKEHTEEDIVQMLISEYDVDKENAENDTAEFLRLLKSIGALK